MRRARLVVENLSFGPTISRRQVSTHHLRTQMQIHRRGSSHGTEGIRLALAMMRTIARRHGARLELGGLRATVRFAAQ